MPGLPEWNEGPGRQRYGSARSVRSVRSASSATSAAGSQRSTVSMPAHLNRENLAGTRRVVAGQGPLYIGPWQEYTLSVLMAQDRRMAAAEGPERGGGRDVHGGGGAVSPVGSYSTMDSRASSPWVPPATDQTGVITALFRHARNLKYNGPRYDRPWRAPRAAKPPLHSGGQLPTIPQVPGGMRQARVAQMQSIYGFNSGVDHALKEELERQKVSELKRRAKSIGVTPAQMDEVDDSDDPKGELVKMLLQASRAAAAAAAACPTTDGPDHLSELYVPQFDVPASRPSPKFARPSPLDTAGPLLPARPDMLLNTSMGRSQGLSTWSEPRSARGEPRSPSRTPPVFANPSLNRTISPTKSSRAISPREDFVDDLLLWAEGIDEGAMDFD